MKEKTRIIELGGARYQLRRLAASVGSYALMKMLGIALNQARERPESIVPPERDMSEQSGEERARTLVAAVLLSGSDEQFHQYLQHHCLTVCARVETKEGIDVPMPLMTAAGAWAVPEVGEDFMLLTRLTIEVLAFNFADFFEQGGIGMFDQKAALSPSSSQP